MIVILKYNAGNISSVKNTLDRLGYQSMVSNNHDEIRRAKKLIIPGVGEASSAMKYLEENGLDQLIISLEQPVLGICLGLQLLCKSSEEGNVKCLGAFDSEVIKFTGTEIIPHMGWNNFQETKGKLTNNIAIEENVYYVHSYYAELGKDTKSICNYITPFSATLEKKNFFATKFHPEKSADIGEKILLNFLTL
jgi:glutamine amidotransferase